MNQDQVEHTIFPLQDLLKTEVRVEAKRRGLHVSDKKDSVGICFIGDINVHEFLKERLGENPGKVVDTAGNIIGTHKGLWFYTVGQRNGFQINAKTVIKMDDGTTIDKHNIPPFYVIHKDAQKNQLVVGFGAETLNDKFGVRNLHWIVDKNEKLAENNSEKNEKLALCGELTTGKNPIIDPNDLFVRIRHTGELLKCSLGFITPSKKNSENNLVANIKLNLPTKGVAYGQSAVLYKKIGNKTICLGGGIIACA